MYLKHTRTEDVVRGFVKHGFEGCWHKCQQPSNSTVEKQQSDQPAIHREGQPRWHTNDL